MTAPIHRCTDSQCPYRGQPTRKTCGCHKTGEQMLLEQRAALLDACKAFLADYDNHYDGDPMFADTLDAIEAMRAAVEQAEAA